MKSKPKFKAGDRIMSVFEQFGEGVILSGPKKHARPDTYDVEFEYHGNCLMYENEMWHSRNGLDRVLDEIS